MMKASNILRRLFESHREKQAEVKRLQLLLLDALVVLDDHNPDVQKRLLIGFFESNCITLPIGIIDPSDIIALLMQNGLFDKWLAYYTQQRVDLCTRIYKELGL